MKLLNTRAILAASVLWSFTCTAWADKPVKESFSFFDPAFPIAECDGFDVLSSSTIEGTLWLWFDEEGNVVRVRQHLAYVDDVWYNSEYPDIRVNAGPGQVEIQGYDLLGDPPTILFTGSSARVTLPGYGVVLLATGYLLRDFNTGEVIYKRGPQDLIDGNFDAICAVLSS
jgi:hypothetical protein